MFENVNLLEELDSLSKIHPFHRERIDELMKIVGERLCKALRIERINAWIFESEKKEKLICIGAFDTRTGTFSKGETLMVSQYPEYFKALYQNVLIHAPNIHTHPFTKEFSDNYAKKHDVISLMDIPIRIGGKIEGVLCYEKTGKQEKKFTEEEQTFALACAQILASNLEARKRRKYQMELEKTIKEKELLLKEINHRVKNNLSLLLSLCKIYKNKAHHAETIEIIDAIISDIQSMNLIQEFMLINTQSFYKVNIRAYLEKILHEYCHEVREMGDSYSCVFNIPDLFLDSKQAMYLGMIVGEILQNTIKYYFSNNEGIKKEYKKFYVEGKKENGSFRIKVGDDGPGFDFHEKIQGSGSLGLEIIRDLVNTVGHFLEYPSKGKSFYVFVIS